LVLFRYVSYLEASQVQPAKEEEEEEEIKRWEKERRKKNLLPFEKSPLSNKTQQGIFFFS
jgi:hypothetical protein